MDSMILVTSNSREYLSSLKKIPEAMQQVTAATLTDTAQAVTKRGERNIRREMIVRTPYTTKSLVTYKASPAKPIARQNSIAGTKSDYLPVQDDGGVIRARNKRIAVPTNAIRGADRKKKVPSSMRLDKNRVQYERPFAKGGKLFVLYPTLKSSDDEENWYKKKSRHGRVRRYETFGRKGRGSHGAYRLSSPGIFTRKGGKLIKVRDLSLSRVKVKATKWHREAVKMYGNYPTMARFFQVNAHRFLRGKAALIPFRKR